MDYDLKAIFFLNFFFENVLRRDCSRDRQRVLTGARTHAHSKILKHAHAHARARENNFRVRTRTHAHAVENFAHVYKIMF